MSSPVLHLFLISRVFKRESAGTVQIGALPSLAIATTAANALYNVRNDAKPEPPWTEITDLVSCSAIEPPFLQKILNEVIMSSDATSRTTN